MALGTGSALAHRAVDAVLGSRHPEPAQATAAAQELVRDNAPCSEQVGLLRLQRRRGGAHGAWGAELVLWVAGRPVTSVSVQRVRRPALVPSTCGV